MCEDRISMQNRRKEIIQGLKNLPGEYHPQSQKLGLVLTELIFLHIAVNFQSGRGGMPNDFLPPPVENNSKIFHHLKKFNAFRLPTQIKN